VIDRDTLPATIAGECELETLLSEPTDRLVGMMARLDGDIVVLGASGKMGPTLARMAKRAADAAGPPRRVIAVSRFGDPSREAALEAHGVETIRCDLLDERAVARLPAAANVIFMTGRKFGSTGAESLTWATNCLIPAVICRHFAASRIVAFSTGNVYGLTETGRGGSTESDVPQPVGEYAMSCLGRERLFENSSRTLGTPVAIVRLNYAVEMRYGILVDLAQRVLAGEAVDLAMGYVNVIWQADASAMALCALERAASPPFVVNLAGLEELSVRDVSLDLGARFGRSVRFRGEEGPDALLSDGRLGAALLGPLRVPSSRLIEWTVDWLTRGGATSGKPTHFDSRAGRF
jgi:nucleoside-diphosphate-sugar epimerase